MKYRICKNMNGNYKIQYKFIWWKNLTEGYGRGLRTVTFDTLEEAEKRILYEKKKVIAKKKDEEKKTRANNWSCMGEY